MRIFLSLLVLLSACAAPDARTTAIVGATALLPGGESIADSVAVVKGTRLIRLGTRAETPIPAGSDKVDGAGKYLLADPDAGGELRQGARANLVLASDPAGAPPRTTMREGKWLQ
ncbi:MAG: hypothetical protein R2762_03160 [Bryobacteraceae bacterium]